MITPLHLPATALACLLLVGCAGGGASSPSRVAAPPAAATSDVCQDNGTFRCATRVIPGDYARRVRDSNSTIFKYFTLYVTRPGTYTVTLSDRTRSYAAFLLDADGEYIRELRAPQHSGNLFSDIFSALESDGETQSRPDYTVHIGSEGDYTVAIGDRSQGSDDCCAHEYNLLIRRQ